jgi:hypothetical protein
MVSLSKSSYKSKEKTRSFEVRVLPFIEIERSIQRDDSHAQAPKHMEQTNLSEVNEQPHTLQMQSSIVNEKESPPKMLEVYNHSPHQSQEQVDVNENHESNVAEHAPNMKGPMQTDKKHTKVVEKEKNKNKKRTSIEDEKSKKTRKMKKTTAIIKSDELTTFLKFGVMSLLATFAESYFKSREEGSYQHQGAM